MTTGGNENGPPASFRRRRALLVRNPVGNPPPGEVLTPEATSQRESRYYRGSGAVFSPKGAFSQRSRTKETLRRQNDAGAWAVEENPYETGLQAPRARCLAAGAAFCVNSSTNRDASEIGDRTPDTLADGSMRELLLGLVRGQDAGMSHVVRRSGLLPVRLQPLHKRAVPPRNHRKGARAPRRSAAFRASRRLMPV